jgi:hypothetical protein
LEGTAAAMDGERKKIRRDTKQAFGLLGDKKREKEVSDEGKRRGGLLLLRLLLLYTTPTI